MEWKEKRFLNILFFFVKSIFSPCSVFTEFFLKNCQDTIPLHSVEKRAILSHWKKFRQIKYLVISLVKPLFSRDFCKEIVRENFCNFHTVSRQLRWLQKMLTFAIRTLTIIIFLLTSEICGNVASSSLLEKLFTNTIRL